MNGLAPRRILVVCVLLAMACSIGCRKKDNPGKPPRVMLREKYPPGKYVIRVEQEIKQKIRVERQRQKMSASALIVVDLQVAEPDADGRKTASFTYRRFRMVTNGQVVDTDDPPSTDTHSPQGKVDRLLREFLKARITVHFTPSDEISRVEGFDELWDRASRAVPAANQILSQIRQSMGDRMVKEWMSASGDILPSHEVGVGAVWHPTATRNLPIVGRTEYEMECELTRFRDTPAGKVAVIVFTAEVASKTPGGLEVGEVSTKITDIDLEQEGEFHLNVDTGIVQRQIIKQEGEIEMDLRAPNGKTASGTSDLEVSVTITVDRLPPGM